MLRSARGEVELTQHVLAVHDHNEITCPGQSQKGKWVNSGVQEGIERDLIFWEFLVAEVFCKDPSATQLHSSILTPRLLQGSLAGVKVYLPCTQTLPRVASPVSWVTREGEFCQWKPLEGSQEFELRTGIGEISTSDVHTSEHQMHSALKQVRKEAAAGSETSPHKYLWTVTLPMALALQHRSPFWAAFLQNPQKSSYDHQPQTSCMAPALGVSYSELVQRLNKMWRV